MIYPIIERLSDFYHGLLRKILHPPIKTVMCRYWLGSKSMNNQEFVHFCYKRILQRSPEQESLIYYTNALDSNHLSREDLIITFFTCQEFESITLSQEFVPTGHFYSAVPSFEERQAFAASNVENNNVLGITLNEERQIDFLNKFKRYYDECPFTDHKGKEFRYYFLNPAYSYADALTLYSMMRHFRPKRIIEIGSGFSSCAMLDTSEHYFNGEIDFTFIEPYPELLYSLINNKDRKYKIIPHKVQEVDAKIFADLEQNDIVFVDSTHVSKLNSDVNRIFFEILPSLQQGVLIHFHDIFWPFEYPKDWINEGRAWNEAYILRAFLQFNESFEILFFASYLHKHKYQWFQENMPLYLQNPGGNIWLRKVKNNS